MNMNKFANIVALVFLLVTLVLEVLYGYKMINISIYSYFIVFFGLISLIIYIINKFKNKEFKFYELLILLMSILSFLSYIFAKDKYIALHGFYLGREGLLVLLSYNSFMLLGSVMKKDKLEIIEKIFLIIVGINIMFAILQALKVPIPLPTIYDYPGGLLYSASFYSTLTLLGVLLLLSKYLYKDNRIIILVLLLFFIFGMFLSNVLSSLLAFTIIWFVIIVINIVSKNKKQLFKNLLLLIFISVVFIISNVINKNILFNDIKETVIDSNKVIEGKKVSSFGNGRIHIWSKGFYYFNKYNYYTYGIGIDNFIFIGKDKYLKDWNNKKIVYKAHNEFLQILFCEGIYCFLIYLVLIGYMEYTSIKKIRKSKKKNKYYLITLFITVNGYIIQSVFNISTILVAPFYYYLFGLLLGGEKSD